MKRRSVVGLLGLAAAGLILSSSGAAAEEKTVTLAIRGMTWGACVDTVRSALESVKGVKEAKVSLEENEAVVMYDPEVAKVEDLIKAVKDARGMHKYDAKVKEK